ncbi:MAG TPA: hypothetical protein PKE55_05290 [Kiritimatiellia bacterium]|nr:hypothetical protein [Kiritimatiellia bacterium]
MKADVFLGRGWGGRVAALLVAGGMVSAEEPRLWRLPTGGVAVEAPGDLSYPAKDARMVFTPLTSLGGEEVLAEGSGLFVRSAPAPMWSWDQIDGNVWLDQRENGVEVWMIPSPLVPRLGTLAVLPPMDDAGGEEGRVVGYSLDQVEDFEPAAPVALPVDGALIRWAGSSLTARLNERLHQEDWLIEDVDWTPQWRPGRGVPEFPFEVEVSDAITGARELLSGGMISTGGEGLRWTVAGLDLTWDFLFPDEEGEGVFVVQGLVYGEGGRVVRMEFRLRGPDGFRYENLDSDGSSEGAAGWVGERHWVLVANDPRVPRQVEGWGDEEAGVGGLRYTLALGPEDSTYPGQASWRWLMDHGPVADGDAGRGARNRLRALAMPDTAMKHREGLIRLWSRAVADASNPPRFAEARDAFLIPVPAGVEGLDGERGVVSARGLAWLRLVAGSSRHPLRHGASAALFSGMMTEDLQLAGGAWGTGALAIPLNPDPALNHEVADSANGATWLAGSLGRGVAGVVVDDGAFPVWDFNPAARRGLADGLGWDEENGKVGVWTDSAKAAWLRAIEGWAAEAGVPVLMRSEGVPSRVASGFADGFVWMPMRGDVSFAERMREAEEVRTRAGSRVVGTTAQEEREIRAALAYGFLPGLPEGGLRQEFPVWLFPWVQRMAELGWNPAGPVKAEEKGILLEHFGWGSGEEGGVVSVWNATGQARLARLGVPDEFSGWAVIADSGATVRLGGQGGRFSMALPLEAEEVAWVAFVPRERMEAERARLRVMPWSALRFANLLENLDRAEAEERAGFWLDFVVSGERGNAAEIHVGNGGNEEMTIRSVRLRQARATTRVAGPRVTLGSGEVYRSVIDLPPASPGEGLVTLLVEVERRGSRMQTERRLHY